MNEIKIYKEKIKELENNQNKKNKNLIQYKWCRNQKKNIFTLSNDNKDIKINYTSGYNIFYVDFNFNDNIEYSLGISLMVPDYINKYKTVITDWEATGRYDMHFVVKLAQLKKCHQVVKEWYDVMRKEGFA